MKIGIILNPYGEEKPGGLARTILEWTRGLLEVDKENEYIIYLKKSPKNPPDLPGKNWKMEFLGSGLFWLNNLKRASQADVYLFQTPVLPIFFRPKRSVIIVQDFPYLYPKTKKKSLKMRLRDKLIYYYHAFSLKRADAIIAVSESTKKDLIRFFDVPEKKITVIYMGYKKICDTPETKVALPDKFFLFTGVIKERKNTLNIVKAFIKFKESDDKNFKLVFAGKSEGKYFEDIKKYLIDEKLIKDVVFLGFMNDGQLSFVYKRATALIFPSIVESFGMPILEAMDCGVPVITSNIFGPAELGGNAAILIDPYNGEEMACAMKNIAENPSLRDELIKKGFEQAKMFNWEKAAKETLELFESL